MIEDKRAVYGIIGNPVKHSLSPLMHNAAFELLGVNAEYKLFPLEENEVEDFFMNLREKSSPIFGLNVTVPYKEIALSFLDNCTPLVERIGAVNTIVITEERKLIGYNTDSPGFLSHLIELQFNSSGKRVAIMGAGGSARAIIATLCMIPERPESIKIYNRTSSRLDSLLADLSQRIDISIVHPVDSIDDLDIELSDLLINTTSVGLNQEDPCLISGDLIHSNLLVYDLVYNPQETALIKLALEKGAKACNGLGMLYYQGVLAFQHWANIQIDTQVKKVMREALLAGAGREETS